MVATRARCTLGQVVARARGSRHLCATGAATFVGRARVARRVEPGLAASYRALGQVVARARSPCHLCAI